MIRIAISQRIILNTPKLFSGKRCVAASDQMIKKTVQKIPEAPYLVDWKNDIWDFNSYFKLSRRYNNVLRFGAFDMSVRDYIKGFITYLVDDGIKISTANGRLTALRQAITKTMTDNKMSSFFLVTTDTLLRTVEAKTKTSPVMAMEQLVVLKQFFDYLQEEHDIWIPVDTERLEHCRKNISDVLSKMKSRRRYADIPEPLYSESLQMYNDVMRNPEEPLRYRMTAGMYLIASQTGIRALELCALGKDPIRYVETREGLLPSIIYWSHKSARGTTEANKIVTFCTPLAERTIKYLQELRKQCPNADKSDFLYVLEGHTMKTKKCLETGPMSSERLGDTHKRMFIDKLPDLASKNWKGLPRIVSKRKAKAKKGLTYTVPSVHNYRTHFATALNHQGFPLDFIECVMSHSYTDLDIGGYCQETITEDKVKRAWDEINNADVQNQIEQIIYERERIEQPDGLTD